MTRTTWTFLITAMAVFMAALDNLVVTTALPVIRADFGATLSELEWIVNAYTLTFAVLLLTGAALGDRFGRRRLFIIGLAVFGGRIDALLLFALMLRQAQGTDGRFRGDGCHPLIDVVHKLTGPICLARS
jgi:MFS family permease